MLQSSPYDPLPPDDSWERGFELTVEEAQAAPHLVSHKPHYQPQPNKLIAQDGNSFLAMSIPPRDYMLGRWLPTKGLAMVHAWRGVGKTLFSLSVAVAIATGREFAQWQASSSRPVLYIDGEMPARLMQSRLKQIAAGADLSNFRILCDDQHEDGLPDLTSPASQAAVEGLLEPSSLLVLDNISCLFRSGSDENDARSWNAAADWLKSLRRKGHTVLLVHHSGKGGAQRGTSKREDLLDTVVALKRPDGYSAEQGATFEVHFEKSRSAFGDDVVPCLLSYKVGEDMYAQWKRDPIQDNEYQAVVDELNGGQTIRDIAKDLGLSKSSIGRHRRKAIQEGDFASKKNSE